MYLVQYFTEFYTTISFEIHPLLKEKYLTNSVIPTVFILLLYGLFILKLGPAYMKNRTPYNLKYIIAVYNIIQVICNAYLFYKVLGVLSHLNWYCEPVRLDDTPITKALVIGHYQYYLLKIFDLLDTIFFVLRKKDKQVTFLHVYHHVAVVGFTWAGLRYAPGGTPCASIGLLNVSVHIVMYTYYFLTSINVNVDRYKKYITQMQLIQHAIMFWTSSFTTFDLSCTYPRMFSFIMWTNAALFLYLFGDFYVKTYSRQKPVKAKSIVTKTK